MLATLKVPPDTRKLPRLVLLSAVMVPELQLITSELTVPLYVVMFKLPLTLVELMVDEAIPAVFVIV